MFPRGQKPSLLLWPELSPSGRKIFKNLILSFPKSLLLIVKTMDNKGQWFWTFWNFFMGKQILPWVKLLTILFLILKLQGCSITPQANPKGWKISTRRRNISVWKMIIQWKNLLSGELFWKCKKSPRHTKRGWWFWFGSILTLSKVFEKSPKL